MYKKLSIALLATSMLTLPSVTSAQELTANDVAAMRAEIASLRAQVETLKSRLDAAKVDAPVFSASPVPAPDAAHASDVPKTEISWNGAPEIKSSDGWSFKPRGRLQIDMAGIDAPAGVMGPRGGVGTEFRRAYLGVDGKIPGGFSYRVEADIANSSVDLTDLYITYGTGPVSVTVGQIKPFWSLDEMTSDLFTTFTERAAFTQAFGFERRVGLSTQYKGKSVLVQAGVFGDNANALLNDANNSVSFDARAIFMPKIGNTQFHLGGSTHWRNFNDQAAITRYRARPFVHTTDMRLVDTGAITATGEHGYGLEAAAISGPFHVTSEGFWQTVKRPGFADPTFFGGYAEVGMVLTPGDRRGYKGGSYDRMAPTHPVTEGGLGAIEVNARYDYLNLNDSGIVGGKQRTAGISLVWAPIQYVRIIANYGHLNFDNAAIATAGGDRNYSADAFGLRTQIDF